MIIFAFPLQQLSVDPDKARGVLDIGTVTEYGPIFFGVLIGACAVYMLQSWGRLPVPSAAVKKLQQELDEERAERIKLGLELATLKERLRHLEGNFQPRLVE